MENLKLYHISDQYIRFLKSRDSKVQDNKNRRRPYVGIVLTVGSFRYFVPMESPKTNHKNIKPGIHIILLNNGRYGLLGFNNMIPVPESAIIAFNIDDEQDDHYRDLLKRQLSIINRSKADIIDSANRTYIGVTSGRNKFLCKISCDFLALERACKQYDPNYRSVKH